MGDALGYRIAVGAVGLALAGFAIAAGVSLAEGHDPSQSFWTVASGLSGALIGILAPSPSQARGGAAAGAAVAAHVSAAAAAGEAVKAHRAQAEMARQQERPAAAAAAAANASLAARAASEQGAQARRAQSGGRSGSVALLLLVFVILEGLLLYAHPPYFDADTGTQVRALASAAGGGAIGLLAPSPAKQ